MTPLLDGLRVLDYSNEIAGPYATKLLADLGADVIKVESAAGDPLRKWSAAHVELKGNDGALFAFVNASKRSVIDDGKTLSALVSGAEILVESGQLSLSEIAELRSRHPGLVIVSVTAYGRRGPWAARPATEFTLQAWCGSIASRGQPDRPPLYAGGRIGEWIAGTYTAVAALGALSEERGAHMDVSVLECMAITLGGYGHLHASLAGAMPEVALRPGPFRSVESPSIEPCKDGLVGFCTVTAQQFSDLGLLIGEPDLAEDPRFRSMLNRMRNHTEFEKRLHAWTYAHTADEIIEQASLLRIPVAPVGRPDTIATFDHFVERGVFVTNPAGFIQPRPPYLVSEAPMRPLAPAPRLGEHNGQGWSARHKPPASPATTARTLSDIRIVDLTAFWAGPSATSVLAALGADVIKIESPWRPDGMRMTSTKTPDSDDWWEWSPVYQANNTNKRDVGIDLGSERGRELVLDLIAAADVVIENSSPRVMDTFGLTWEVVHERNPQAVMVRMPAFGLDGPWRDRTGFAQTMEQASGMAWISGFADRRPVIPRGVCDPLAGMQAVVVLLAALRRRRWTGLGHFIEVTMIEAALNVAAELVIEHTAYDRQLARNGNRGPTAAPQGVYPCVGKESWLALAVETDPQWRSLCAVLGRPSWADDRRFATDSARRAHHDDIDKMLASTISSRSLDDIVTELLERHVPAAPVIGPAAVPLLPQLAERGFVETIDGPVVGRHQVIGLPFRADFHSGPWFRTAAPTLGQHNFEVLSEILGLSNTEIDELVAAGVIGSGLQRRS